jgi:hypothetical protein
VLYILLNSKPQTGIELSKIYSAVRV